MEELEMGVCTNWFFYREYVTFKYSYFYIILKHLIEKNYNSYDLILHINY